MKTFLDVNLLTDDVGERSKNKSGINISYYTVL